MVLCVLLPISLRPCTTFCFKSNGEWIFGRNYDWNIEYGLIMVNKRGLAKTALLQPGASGQPARWVSKYGSVTFNQYGREFPLGGMNEAGLVVEMMWLSQTEYPNADQRPVLQDLQWIQYQLDTAATVEEVIQSDKAVRIDAGKSTPLHFLICDRKGGAAAIEFLGGGLRLHTGKTLPVRALTNNTYEYCLGLWDLCGGDENNSSFKFAGESQKRFVWAGHGVKAGEAGLAAEGPVAYAFQVLDKASTNSTMLRVVYEAKAGLIHFRTKSTPLVRTVDIRRFDFACSTPVKILDVLADLQGDVTDRFSDYSSEANYDLIKKTFGETSFLKDIPEFALRILANYPNSLICK